LGDCGDNCKWYVISPHGVYDGFCVWQVPLSVRRLVSDPTLNQEWRADVTTADTCSAYEFVASVRYEIIPDSVGLTMTSDPVELI